MTTKHINRQFLLASICFACSFSTIGCGSQTNSNHSATEKIPATEIIAELYTETTTQASTSEQLTETSSDQNSIDYWENLASQDHTEQITLNVMTQGAMNAASQWPYKI